MKLDVLSTPPALATVHGAWEHLAESADPGGIFATAAWHEGWLQHIAPDAAPAVAAIRDRAGALVAVAPLCQWPYRDLGFNLPALRFSGREVASGDYLDLVASADARPQATKLLLDHFAESLREGNLLVLGELVRGSATDEALGEWIVREGLNAHCQEERLCPYIPLQGDYDGYLGSLSAKTRKHIRNKTRRIADEPGIEIRRLTDPVEVAKALPELFRLHALRWESRGETGTFVRPGFKEFIAGFVADAPPSVHPNLYLMVDRGIAIAALLVFHTPRVAMYYQGGWDPVTDHAKHSPLLVLIARSISDAIEAGLSVFDFLRGDETYKLDFTSTVRQTFTLVIAGRGLRARGYFVALKMKAKAKSLLQGAAPTAES